MSQDSSWRRKLLRSLRGWAAERFPLTFPVRVYLRPAERMSGHLGYFAMDEDEERGVIAIRDGQERSSLVETFVEEWAHARTIWLCDSEDNNEDPWHHPAFWAEFGRIVQAAREREW